MKTLQQFITILILAFFASCNNDPATPTLDKKDVRGEFSPTVYTTTGNGTWGGTNWTPSAPPANLSNASVVINHTIDYTVSVNINNWNKSDGSVTIHASGVLNINTNNNSLVQSNGFTVINNGSLNMNLGTGQYKIDKAGTLVNSGSISISGDKVFVLDNGYSDTSKVAGAQVINYGTIDMSNTNGLHTDGYISNTGILITSKLENDGYICNSNLIQTSGEVELSSNRIGMIGCGGELRACNIKMIGGKIFDQEICCVSGGVVAPVVVDSSSSQYETGDFHHGSVPTNICEFILATGISLFAANRKDNQVAFYWIITEPEKGDKFIVQRSIDAIEFEDRATVLSEINSAEAAFAAQDELKYGTVYYRLKVLNKSGKEAFYSSIVSLTTNAPNDQFTIFPNPSMGTFSIAGALPKNSTVQLMDMNGRTVYSKVMNGESFNFHVATELPVGIYILQIKTDKEIINTQKIVIQ